MSFTIYSYTTKLTARPAIINIVFIPYFFGSSLMFHFMMGFPTLALLLLYKVLINSMTLLSSLASAHNM